MPIIKQRIALTDIKFMFVTEQRNLEITAADKIAMIIFRLERGFIGSWIITLWIFRNVISQLILRT